jgi:hypothetical protein
VRGRTSQSDDLSFFPPYSQQAKYLLLADKFLSNKVATKTDEKIVYINAHKGKRPAKKAS